MTMIQNRNPQRVPEPGAIGRRSFLGSIATGSIMSVAPLSIDASEAGEAARDKRKALYGESHHVKAFYRVNRYP